MSDHFLGIDLGRTAIKGCMVSDTGEIVDQREKETNDSGDSLWIQGVKELINKFQTDKIKGVGLAAPGIAASNARSIAIMPGRLQGLENLDWTNELNLGFAVAVLNDAHAYTVGEAWIGAAQGCKYVVLLTLGTGVGGGVICDGKLLLGHQSRAGHLGHFSLDPEGAPDCTGLPGSLENAIGELSLPQRSNGKFSTTTELLSAIRDGDDDAAAIWQTSIRALAAAIASFINLFDPEKVVIGGGISNAGNALMEPLQKRLDEIEWQVHGQQVSVVTAKLGSWAGAVGAARHAMEKRKS